MPQDAFKWNSSCPRTGGRKLIFWDNIVIPVKQYFLLIIPSPLFFAEYAGNIGDAKDPAAREAEQSRILQLVDKF